MRIQVCLVYVSLWLLLQNRKLYVPVGRLISGVMAQAVLGLARRTHIIDHHSIQNNDRSVLKIWIDLIPYVPLRGSMGQLYCKVSGNADATPQSYKF